MLFTYLNSNFDGMRNLVIAFNLKKHMIYN
jgi:hypothetical protein